MAVDLGRVAALEAKRGEFSLADGRSGVAGPNFHWLMRLAASSHADEVASVLEGQARSGHPGAEGQEAWSHGSS